LPNKPELPLKWLSPDIGVLAEFFQPKNDFADPYSLVARVIAICEL
jgi:hypothetical protein